MHSSSSKVQTAQVSNFWIHRSNEEFEWREKVPNSARRNGKNQRKKNKMNLRYGWKVVVAVEEWLKQSKRVMKK
jgi:hypothetical protein